MPPLIHDWRAIYQARITALNYRGDSAQLAIVDAFSHLEKALNQNHKPKSTSSFGLFSLLKDRKKHPPKTKGLYLYGSVGRGKTFLMDLFCETVSSPVMRLHFHHFMKKVHDELTQIKGQKDPLKIIAAHFAKTYRVLCLDEFMVTDITDAMLLYGLLSALVDNHVVIVTTTNIAPDDLYKNGLQRERFLPAIALIKSNCLVHQIGGDEDFRRNPLGRHRRFFSPITPSTKAEFTQILAELSPDNAIEHSGEIEINQRQIPFVEKSQNVIWFDFSRLCEGYRSQLDYIALAQKFDCIMVSDIPILDALKEDAARRFLLLVDELYDKRINLVLSSEVPIAQIYTGKKMVFEFDRLQSRLFEMQGKDYGKNALCQK